MLNKSSVYAGRKLAWQGSFAELSKDAKVVRDPTARGKRPRRCLSKDMNLGVYHGRRIP